MIFAIKSKRFWTPIAPNYKTAKNSFQLPHDRQAEKAKAAAKIKLTVRKQPQLPAAHLSRSTR